MKSSKVRLYRGVKIDKSNVTNLTSNNLLNQLETYKLAEFDNLSIVLTTYTLRVPVNYMTIRECNYLSFDNPEYNNKWYFAFIDNIKYISDAVTEISFTIDEWSTYYDNLVMLECFVEREITETDEIGEYLLDENIATGETITIDSKPLMIQGDGSTASLFYIGFYTDYYIAGDQQALVEGQFDGVSFYNLNFNGHMLVVFPIHMNNSFEQDILYLLNYIKYVNLRGHIEDIKDMFIIPFMLIDPSDLTPVTFTFTKDGINYTTSFCNVHATNTVKTILANVEKLYDYDDYQPRNNKCYVYPFNYVEVTNNIGNSNILRYEDFSDQNNATFEIDGSVCIGCSVKITPTNYKGRAKAYDEQLPLGKFPTCGWSADSYVNWLTQNAVNIATDILNKGMSIGSLATMAGGPGAAVSGASSALNLIGAFRQAELAPNIQGGSNTGDVNFGSWCNNFTLNRKRVKLENLRVIDDYFTRYGYKINQVTIPNRSDSRFNHFYIKIGYGENAVAGNLPTVTRNYINDQLYSGLTIWKSLANIGNY